MILALNIASLVIILVFIAFLFVIKQMKGESLGVVFILLTTTLPLNMYILFQTTACAGVARCFEPVAYTAVTLIVPLLYMFVKRNFAINYSYKMFNNYHFIPTLFFLLCFFLAQRSNSIEWLPNLSAQGNDFSQTLKNIFFVIISFQLIVYFVATFKHLRRMRVYIQQNLSDAEWIERLWIPRFMTIFFIMYTISVISNFIFPDMAPLVVQLINTILLVYMVFEEMRMVYIQMHKVVSTTSIRQTEYKTGDGVEAAVEKKIISNREDDNVLLSQYADKVLEWLNQTESYINPKLSIKDISVATGISTNNISKAINQVLGKNFFELINDMRIEKSKELLLNKKELGLTLETIAEKCGFNSRYTLNDVFKRMEKKTTTQWLKAQKDD